MPKKARSAEKSPRTTTQRKASSADNWRIDSPSPAHIALFSALKRSGLLSVTVAIAPSRETRMGPDIYQLIQLTGPRLIHGT